MVVMNSFLAASVGVKLAEKFGSDMYEWNLPSSMYTFTFHEVDDGEVICSLKGLPDYSNLDVLKVKYCLRVSPIHL